MPDDHEDGAADRLLLAAAAGDAPRQGHRQYDRRFCGSGFRGRFPGSGQQRTPRVRPAMRLGFPPTRSPCARPRAHGDIPLVVRTPFPARSFPAVEGQKPWPGRRARLFDHGLRARGNVSSAESGLTDRSISSAGPSKSSTRNGLRPAAIATNTSGPPTSVQPLAPSSASCPPLGRRPVPRPNSGGPRRTAAPAPTMDETGESADQFGADAQHQVQSAAWGTRSPNALLPPSGVSCSTAS